LGQLKNIYIYIMNTGTLCNYFVARDVIFPGANSVHMSEKKMDMFKGKPAWGYIKSMV